MQIKINNFFFLLLLPFIFFISCKTDEKDQITYFGGQIKNPKDNVVYIFKKDKEIAKTSLTKDHKFLFELDSLQAGLYSFKHGKEFQYFFLEPKDSLLVRLNTWDFDESLMFTGKGAKRNNFLIQLFLKNEKDEKLFHNYFSLNEANFVRKTDSLLSIKKALFNEFKIVNNPSKLFSELITMAIHLPIYANKEQYTQKYKIHNKLESLPELSKSFYAFRSDAFLKNNHFNDYYLFENYLWYAIYNVALNRKEHEAKYELSTLLLDEITKKIENNTIKNDMLQQVFINSILENTCGKHDIDKSEQIFFEHCSNTASKNEVKNLLKAVKTLRKNENLCTVKVLDFTGNKVNLKNKLTNKTVLYFWPKELERIDNMSKRIYYLTKKYPKIQFVGIDAQLTIETWKNQILKLGFNKKSQYKMDVNNKGSFFTNGIPRAVVIDKKGVIQTNYTYLTHPNFENYLKNL